MADDLERYRAQFRITAQAALDASKLAYSHIFRLVGLGTASVIVVGIAAILLGVTAIGAALIAAGAFIWLVGSDPVQRWFVQRAARSVIGGVMQIGLSDSKLTYETPIGTGSVPWSSVSAVRENERTVVFMRDRIPIVYIPASAFETPAQRAEIVSFARGLVDASGSAIA